MSANLPNQQYDEEDSSFEARDKGFHASALKVVPDPVQQTSEAALDVSIIIPVYNCLLYTSPSPRDS